MSGGHRDDRRERQAVETLNVTVIGGGVAGLAAAFALASGGHKVTVLEATDGQIKRRGSVRLPPNATLILHRWGLKTTLDNHSQKFTKYNFISSEHDDLIGTVLFNELLQHEAFKQHDMTEFNFLKDSDLWSWVYKLAVDSGVTFRSDSGVKQIESGHSTVILQSGERITSDFIVGADGIGGIAHLAVSGRELEAATNRFLTLACSFSCEELLKDEDLSGLVNEATWAGWGGDGVQLSGQTDKGALTYTMTLAYRIPDDVVLDPALKLFGWQDTHKLEDLTFIDFGKFHGRALKLLNLAKNTRMFVNIHAEQPIPEKLVCENARVVLVGNAAHGLAPALHHNTALGLEDAEALGYLFSRLQSREHVPRLLLAYEEIRQPRIALGVKVDLDQRNAIMMPEGPMRKQRDDLLKKSLAQSDLDHMDEHMFYSLWGETLDMWLYDTIEKVDDWWAQWGAVVMQGHLEHGPPQSPTTVQIDTNVRHERY